MRDEGRGMGGERMSELLPCPFCGGEAKVARDVTCGYETFWAHCLKCHSQANYGHTEAEAIAAWNSRAERTCHNISADGFLCSACTFGDFSSFKFEPHYCPNCGRKVVN